MRGCLLHLFLWLGWGLGGFIFQLYLWAQDPPNFGMVGETMLIQTLFFLFLVWAIGFFILWIRISNEEGMESDVKGAFRGLKMCPYCRKRLPSILTSKCPHCTADL